MKDYALNDWLPWVILFLPLLAALVIGLFGQKEDRLSAAISVTAVSVAFICSVILWVGLVGDLWINEAGNHMALMQKHFVFSESHFNWLSADRLRVDFGVVVDPLSALMLLIVTGVGSMIHFYSIGYMHGDRSYSRFFASLSFFTFSMLGLVLSTNFLQMFIFWELVGVSSYMLIGFWYEKASAADAAKKAFLTNRLGDFGFLCGIILIWAAAGTLNFDSLQTEFFINPKKLGEMATAGGLLIFCGAVGKSAQFPLHVWLPDAMEGPTPVSALIHAATMVAAGVYMLCRAFFVFNTPAYWVIAWIGGITALLAALIAVQQNDIKRILAYSTLSQLGYMVMAVGMTNLNASDPTKPAVFHQPEAMFHLATHACFKALLFLGAGSVIHAMTHEQDIWKMGRLKDKMPTTAWTFLVGTLALCGVWPLSGFYSKDAILGAAATRSPLLFGIGIVVAFLTTLYMFRLMFVVFWGKARSEQASHAHESPRVMVYPLVVLAVASIVAGVIGIPQFVGRQFFVAPDDISIWARIVEPFKESPVAALCGLAAVAFGFFAAMGLYANTATDPLPEKLPALCRVLRNKFYFDEFYAGLIKLTQDGLAMFTGVFDSEILSGLVRMVSGGTELLGRGLRLLQTGNLQTYTFLFVAGAAVALYFVLR